MQDHDTEDINTAQEHIGKASHLLRKRNNRKRKKSENPRKPHLGVQIIKKERSKKS